MSLKFQYFDVMGTLTGSCMPDNVVIRDGFDESSPVIGKRWLKLNTIGEVKNQ